MIKEMVRCVEEAWFLLGPCAACLMLFGTQKSTGFKFDISQRVHCLAGSHNHYVFDSMDAISRSLRRLAFSLIPYHSGICVYSNVLFICAPAEGFITCQDQSALVFFYCSFMPSMRKGLMNRWLHCRGAFRYVDLDGEFDSFWDVQY